MKYYIIENQKRADGEVNHSSTSRQSLASALSYYYERISKMVMTDLFPSVSVMLVDENLKVLEQKSVTTQYVAPTEEVADE